MPQPLVELDQEVDRFAGIERDRAQEILEPRPDRLKLEIGRKLVAQIRRIGERKYLRIRIDEEVERVEHLHVGQEVDRYRELRGLFGKHEPRQPIAVRVLLPVHEMIGRRDGERIARNARAAMRSRPQSDHLRAKADRTAVSIAGGVMQTDQDRHRTLPHYRLAYSASVPSVNRAPKSGSLIIRHATLVWWI